MNSDELIRELGGKLPKSLAKDLVVDFIQLRRDVASETLGRSSPGKFIETVVQVLQFLDTGTYEKTPKIDDYLRNIESRPSTLSDDLRITLARVARANYTLRNKRNIAHKADIDPNIYDLKYLLSSSQWILSEIVRQILTNDMKTAGNIIEQIQIPVTPMVDDFEGKSVVLKAGSTEDELLILLFHYFPEYTSVSQIHLDMNRRPPSTISHIIKSTYDKRFIDGDRQKGFKLTSTGYKEAINRIQK